MLGTDPYLTEGLVTSMYVGEKEQGGGWSEGRWGAGVVCYRGCLMVVGLWSGSGILLYFDLLLGGEVMHKIENSRYSKGMLNTPALHIM